MNVILEKDGKTIEYKSGMAIYLCFNFLPIVGSFIALFLMIVRKQFKGVFLNQLIVAIILTSLFALSLLTGSSLIINVMYFITLGFSAFMTVMYILNANFYSIKQRLDDGYTVVNGNEITVQEAVTKAQAMKKPFWQLLKF